MTEYFHHLLSRHGLFDAPVQGADGFLLRHKIAAAQRTDLLRSHQHQPHHQQCYQCQWNIQNQHTHKNAHHGDHTVEQLRNTLADQLPQRIDVIGIDGHNIPMGMGIKIFNRERFHFLKQIVPDIAQSPLPDIDQDSGLGKRCRHADGIKNRHPKNSCRQRIKFRVLLSDQGKNILIDQSTHKHGSLQAAIH